MCSKNFKGLENDTHMQYQFYVTKVILDNAPNSIMSIAHVVDIQARCKGMDTIHNALGMLHVDFPTHRITVDNNCHLPV
jgi:hypothetical protein